MQYNVYHNILVAICNDFPSVPSTTVFIWFNKYTYILITTSLLSQLYMI